MKTNEQTPYEKWIDACGITQEGFNCEALKTAVFNKVYEYKEQYNYSEYPDSLIMKGPWLEIYRYRNDRFDDFSVYITKDGSLEFFVPMEISPNGVIRFKQKKNCYYFENLRSYMGEDNLKAMFDLKKWLETEARNIYLKEREKDNG